MRDGVEPSSDGGRPQVDVVGNIDQRAPDAVRIAFPFRHPIPFWIKVGFGANSTLARSSTSVMPKTFNPDDATTVKRSKFGVWELYEDVGSKIVNIPIVSNLETLWESLDCLPYVWRMFKDIANIPGCLTYLSLYLLLEVGLSLLPALGVWYSGQLLQVVSRVVSQNEWQLTLLPRSKPQSRSGQSKKPSSFALPSDAVSPSSPSVSSPTCKIVSSHP